MSIFGGVQTYTCARCGSEHLKGTMCPSLINYTVMPAPDRITELEERVQALEATLEEISRKPGFTAQVATDALEEIPTPERIYKELLRKAFAAGADFSHDLTNGPDFDEWYASRIGIEDKEEMNDNTEAA